MKLNKALIVKELDRVTTSRGFRNKPVMKRLLAYLVNEHLEGRSGQIKGFTIAVDVFGQGKEFDSDKSALVRNSAVRLRGLLDAYYLGEGRLDPVRIDVPKGGYAPHIAVNDPSAETQPSQESGSRFPGVAVLPFSFFGSDRALEYLAGGFAQELSDALTRFEDMRVIGVGTPSPNDDLRPRLADELIAKRVDYLISGTVKVQKEQGTLRVRLIQAEDDQQLWEERFEFDLSLDNFFQIQESIAGQIASHIGGEYGRINQAALQALMHNRPRTLNEHEALLKHYHSTSVLTEETVLDYQETLARALQNDPDSPLLNALAASGYSSVWFNEFPGFEEALEKFAFHAEKAYALNPNHQLIAGTLAAKCFAFDERERLFSLYERHEKWTANSPLRLGAWAIWIFYFGEWEQGMAITRDVLNNNIDVPSWFHGLPCMYHYRRRDFESALIDADKVQVPGIFWGPALRTSVYGQLGREDKAKAEYEALLACRPDFPERGRFLLGRFFKTGGLLEQFTEGFEKIGVKLA